MVATVGMVRVVMIMDGNDSYGDVGGIIDDSGGKGDEEDEDEESVLHSKTT